MLESGLIINNSQVVTFTEKLHRFADDMANKVIRAGVTEAAKPLKASLEFQANIHRGTRTPVRRDGRPREHYADSITIKIWRRPDGGGYGAYVGAPVQEQTHGHFLQGGTKQRWTKAGRYTGFVAPYHIMTNAENAGMPAAVERFEMTVRQKIQEFMNNYGTRSA